MPRLACPLCGGQHRLSQCPNWRVKIAGKVPRKPAPMRESKPGQISQERPETRMDAGLWPWIVIPVVVGSSPISHPK